MEPVRGVVASVSCNDVYSFTKPVRDEIVLVAGLGVEGDTHAGVHVRHRSRVRADPAQPNLRQVHLIHEELFTEVAAKGYEVGPGNLGENVTTRGLDLLGLPVGTILRFGPAAEPAPVERGNDSAPVERGDDSAPGGGAGATSGESGGGVLAEVLAATEVATSGESGGGGVLAGVSAAAEAATVDAATARAAAAVRAAVGREAAAERARGVDSRAALVVAGLRNPCAQINGFRAGLLREVIGQDENGAVVRKSGVMAVVLRGGVLRPGDVITAELPPQPHAALERV